MMAWLRKGPPAEVSSDEDENSEGDASDAGEASAATVGGSEPPSELSKEIPPVGGEPGEGRGPWRLYRAYSKIRSHNTRSHTVN